MVGAPKIVMVFVPSPTNEPYGGTQCSIVHQLYPKACVDIKNDQLKAVKAALRLSQRLVHALVFKVGFYF